MSTVNLNTNTSSVQDTTTTTGPTTSTTSSAEWKKLLMAALQQEETQATDKKHKHRPHHASINALESLFDEATTQGILTTDEDAQVKDILEKRRQSKLDGTDSMKEIFQILQTYLAPPSVTTPDESTTTTPASSVEALKAKMQTAQAERLEKLKAAVAAAKAANALTATQVTTAESFIGDEETLAAVMRKVNAAGL